MAKIGIIGTGWGARVQVPAFREAGLEVVAIAANDPDKTARAAGELGLRAYRHWRDLLESDVDLVTIVTPPSTHFEIASAALAAGKHVLSEKPTAMNAREAADLVDASASRPDQLFLIDHELRFLPAWRDARARIKDAGEIRFIDCRYSSPSRADRKRAWNWWSDEAHGGGVWGAIGSHLVDSVRYFAGEIVAARGLFSTFVIERPYEGSTRRVTSDDFASVQCELANGAIASMSMTVVAAFEEPTSITIHCERGAFRLVDEALYYAPAGGKLERVEGGPLAERPGNSPGGAFGSGTYYLGCALRDSLDEHRREALKPAAFATDGLAQQKVLDAARRSALEGGRREPV